MRGGTSFDNLYIGDAWWLQQLCLDLHCGGVKRWGESRKDRGLGGIRMKFCEFDVWWI